MTSSPINNEESQETKRPLNFSIDHILNKAGNSKQDVGGNLTSAVSMLSLPWLQCTRYCPPRIPRRKEPPQRRQLGRHPRIPFSTHQLAVLEEQFRCSPYLSSQEVKEISKRLHLADIRVKIWFQNRRARERRERSTQREQIANASQYKIVQSNQSPKISSRINPAPSISTNVNHIQLPIKRQNYSQIDLHMVNANSLPNNFQNHL